jgi:precorrin-6B methylase 2
MKILSPNDKQFIREHLADDVNQLALKKPPRFSPEMDFPFLLNQIAGRQRIKNKMPSWYRQDNLIYPCLLSLEQCSSEITARYKASLLSGNTFADLTGGFGVDTAFIARNFTQVDYVEKQNELVELAAHNFPVLGLSNIRIHVADGVPYLREMEPVDCIYLDPARRSGYGKKVMLIEDCDPNLLDIQDLLLEKAGQVLVKLSPMLDIKSALKRLKSVGEIHVVSLENECKELLFLLQKEAKEEPPVTCMNFRKNGDCQKFTFSFSEERNAVVPCTHETGTYLYEPNVSILKAGFYKGIALRYCLKKLHPDSHLYTSSELHKGFPGRVFQIEAVSSLNRRELKERFPGLEKAHISIRNFPLSVEELRKRGKWKEGGDIYLFATTLANGKHVLIKTARISVQKPSAFN